MDISIEVEESEDLATWGDLRAEEEPPPAHSILQVWEVRGVRIMEWPAGQFRILPPPERSGGAE